MRVIRVNVRDFRSYPDAEAAFGPGLTVITGPNGAGKTNLLEALYFGCTGRSCRTTNEREVVRFGQSTGRTSCRSVFSPASPSACASTVPPSSGCSTWRNGHWSACSCLTAWS
jgi:recombinational DNA repair ATPase RecF